MVNVTTAVVIDGMTIDPDEVYVVKTNNCNYYIGYISGYVADGDAILFSKVFSGMNQSISFNDSVHRGIVKSVEKFEDMGFGV